MANRTDKPLASARRRMRRDAWEQKRAARAMSDTSRLTASAPSPPPTPAAELMVALKASLTKRDRLVATIRETVERIVGQSSRASLDRLLATLSAPRARAGTT